MLSLVTLGSIARTQLMWPSDMPLNLRLVGRMVNIAPATRSIHGFLTGRGACDR